MQVLKAAMLYFGLVFGAGFILGPVRILWLVPRLGDRIAELIEAPIMLGVIVLAARWLGRQRCLPIRPFGRLAVGLVALACLLGAEFTVVLGLRGMTIDEYFASRDPVAGAVYGLMLGAFALMPLLAAATRESAEHDSR